MGMLMALTRLIYFSENKIGIARRNKQMADLQAVAVDRNRKVQVTGALAYDDLWFVQALEGEEAAVKSTFDRIARDKRHANTKIIKFANVPARLFGEWSMGFAARNAKTDSLFGQHWCNKGMNPSSMTEQGILTLMVELGRMGGMSGRIRAA
jgi:Sensors of blue-light using FAD